MSASNYEIYAERKQVGYMSKVITKSDCMEQFKKDKGLLSARVIVNERSFIAAIFCSDSRVSLSKCINKIKQDMAVYSEVTIEDEIEFTASVFGVSSDEIRSAVNGKRYWIV